jgi:hypothetical protein
MRRALAAAWAVGLALPNVSGAQAASPPRTEVVHRIPGDTIDHSYRAYLPAGRARALVVLLSGYPGTINGFEPGSSDAPSTLPALLAARGIATVVAVARANTLYADEASLRALDTVVAEVRARYLVQNAPVAIGGFSAGGTGAVRFAERCAARACGGNPPVAALFAVDAPLDFARLWRAGELSLARRGPRVNQGETRLVLDHLRRALGGSPDDFAAAYRRGSPLRAGAAEGGNARWLRATPVRAYTEPDVQWWLENRNLDYTAMNATDLAALINILRIAGNERATLITTSGRGVRPNGMRHPHSWSIVDEPELAQWLTGILGGA